MANEPQPGIGAVRIGPNAADLVAAGVQPGGALTNPESDLYGARAQLAKVEALELENTQLKNDIEDRKNYAVKIFYLICAWLLAVLWIVCQVGLKRMTLGDSVLIALITTTTVNVLGLFLVVANYLFHRPKKDPPSTIPPSP